MRAIYILPGYVILLMSSAQIVWGSRMRSPR
jgi:hypothetical protein